MADILNVNDLGLLSRAEILESLQKDPLLVSEKHLVSIGQDDVSMKYQTLLKQESLLNRELHELTSLRSISGLILEFKANFELLELENCYYSLQNLRKKLRDGSSLTGQTLSFQQSVFSHVDTMHLQLVSKLYEIISQCFWQVDDNIITFNKVVEWGEGNFEAMEYIPFITSIEQQYYPDGFLDPNMWVIKHVEVGSVQDAVIENLSSMLEKYLNLGVIINTINQFIFKRKSKIIWENLGNTQKLRLQQVDEDMISVKVSNILNVVNFIDQGLSAHDVPTFVEKLGPLLATELLKTIRYNAYSILESSGSGMKEEVRLVNEKLKILAKDNMQWNYQGSDVDHLLNDNELHKNFLLDSIFENYALKIRSIFRDPEFKKLEKVNTIQKISSEKGSENQGVGDSYDEWNWEEGDDKDDDSENEVVPNFEDNRSTSRKRRKDNRNKTYETDGWDQEVNINFESSEEEESQKTDQFGRKSGKGDDKSDEEEWGWDLDIDEMEISSPAKYMQNTRDINDTQVSSMALKFINIITEFHNAMEETTKVQFEEDHSSQHKLNVLQTLFFAISGRYFQDDWWRLFIDLRYILHCIPALTRLQELMANLLRTYSNSSLAIVNQLIEEQIQQLIDNEAHPSFYKTEKELLPFLKNRIINPLTAIGGDEGIACLLDFYKYLYVDCIDNRILNWDVISEQNSENLARLVSTIYQKTDAPKLSGNSRYSRYRDKLLMVGKLLQLHLKEIMNMFYNGDFYLFSTEELVQWLVLLFAETPLRHDAIKEIYDIRGAAVSTNDS